jgi:hypothetical protein
MLWLAEGLAVYASGQLDAEYASDARNRFTQGYVPASLDSILNESVGYGLAGDLLRYIDRTWGRPALRSLTRARTKAEAPTVLNVSEVALLERWPVIHPNLMARSWFGEAFAAGFRAQWRI